MSIYIYVYVNLYDDCEVYDSGMMFSCKVFSTCKRCALIIRPRHASYHGFWLVGGVIKVTFVFLVCGGWAPLLDDVNEETVYMIHLQYWDCNRIR